MDGLTWLLTFVLTLWINRNRKYLFLKPVLWNIAYNRLNHNEYQILYDTCWLQNFVYKIFNSRSATNFTLFISVVVNLVFWLLLASQMLIKEVYSYFLQNFYWNCLSNQIHFYLINIEFLKIKIINSNEKWIIIKIKFRLFYFKLL